MGNDQQNRYVTVYRCAVFASVCLLIISLEVHLLPNILQDCVRILAGCLSAFVQCVILSTTSKMSIRQC
jgi:hypothetical protein